MEPRKHDCSDTGSYMGLIHACSASRHATRSLPFVIHLLRDLRVHALLPVFLCVTLIPL